jgi:hypothetical protein
VYIEGARSWLTRTRETAAGEPSPDRAENGPDIARRPLDTTLATDER